MKKETPQGMDRQRSRLNALGMVLAKTDRILTGNRKITVAIKQPAYGFPEKVPAYSNGQDITINSDLINDLGSKGTLMTIQGLNYHELCHILYTPRAGQSYGLRQWVDQYGFQMTFNILEDQRIETLFTSKYKPARHYFIQMALDHLMSDKENWPRAHVLMHGRRYIPKAIRDEFAARWADQSQVEKISKIIDEYRLLDLTNQIDVGHAKVLIEDLATLLRKMPQQDKNNLEEMSDCNQRNTEGDSEQQGDPDKQASKDAKDAAKKETEEQDEKEKNGEDGSNFWDGSDEEEEDGEEGSGDENSTEENDSDANSGDSNESDDGEGDSDSGEGSGDGAGDSDDSADSDGGNGDGGDSSDSESLESQDDPEEGDAGKGVQGDGMTESQLSEELDDVLNAISDNEQINEDVRQLSAAMNDPHNFDLDAPNSKTVMVDIPTHVRSAAKKVSDEFRRLYAEMEPGWNYGADEGRLNVQRAMNHEEDEDIFDEWDAGRQESSGLELVIALDVSGSMQDYKDWRNMKFGTGTPIEAACFAVWIMKRACEELGATVSVVGFGSETTTIVPRNEKARNDKAVYVTELEGSTMPGEAFAIARCVLANSEQPNKLFVVVTDGIWGNTYRPSRYLGADRSSWNAAHSTQLPSLLKQIDATKIFLGIGQEAQPQYQDRFDVIRQIDNAEEIVPVVKHAIQTMLKKVK